MMAGRILVIEDNSANLELMLYLLQAFGHTTLAAENGQTGLELARREIPDVILCDIQLPDIDGYEVARQLKASPALQHIPRVAVTAMAMVGDRDKLLAAGFDGYIGKPVQPETLIQEVEAFLPAGLASLRSPGVFNPPPSAPPVTEKSQTRATILLVDDSATNTELGRAILETAGYRVVAAHSVASALEIARRAPHPDLVLSDVHMPSQDGYDFYREWSADQSLRSIPFVFISSTSSVLRTGHSMQAAGCPQVKFLVRPLEPQALLAEIESSLQAPAIPVITEIPNV
jgi:two-component system cell cycle response regulator